MSAITGIYHPYENPIDFQNLEKMTQILSHRGADDFGIWSESFIGFGHRMLWTTPESLVEKLPLISKNANLVITADARIDNRDELIDLLDLKNIPAKEVSDSQLILSSYEKWGNSCVDRLIGDFAFAIWDGRRKLLFCARDRFGIKPFYYYHSDRAFIFASEIKGLFCVPEVPRKLNQTRIGNYLASITDDKQITFYQNILRLPPACTLEVNKEGIKIESYWSVDSKYELKLDSDEDYADKFRELFTEAVRCRLRSAYPVGSMLSGGLDSSSITCVAKKILKENAKERLQTFSFVFDKISESDERSFINTVIDRGGISPNYIHGDRVSPLVDIEKIFWYQDEPLYLADLYLDWKTYELANQLGNRIILDGFDGDGVISYGLGYLRELKRTGQLQKLFFEVREYAKNILGYSQNVDVSWQTTESKSKKDSPAYFRESLLNDKFVEQIEFIKQDRALAKKRYDLDTTQRQEHCDNLNRGALVARIEELDKTAAAFGVELRYPFLDKRLVEFCVSLPTEQKMQLGWTRMILRRGMEGILPKEVQWRGSKGDLGHNFEYGLKTFGKENLEQMFKESESIEEYINVSYLKRIYKDLIDEKKTTKHILSIWKAVNLFLWFKWFDSTY